MTWPFEAMVIALPMVAYGFPELPSPVVSLPVVATCQSPLDGAGMSKVDESALVSPLEVKRNCAPLTSAALVAVRFAKVAIPEDAATVAVPPRVQEFASCFAAVTLADEDVTVLSYWSQTFTMG
jgi:hypothetical protein